MTDSSTDPDTYDVNFSDQTIIADVYNIAYDDAENGTQFGPLLPVGTVLPWPGTSADVPAGWVICDGINSLTNGQKTPDLRGKFIRAVNGTEATVYGDGATAVAFSGTVNTVTAGSHQHKFPDGFDNVTTNHHSTGTYIIHNTGGAVSNEKTASGGGHTHPADFSAGVTLSNDLDGQIVPQWTANYYIIKLD